MEVLFFIPIIFVIIIITANSINTSIYDVNTSEFNPNRSRLSPEQVNILSLYSKYYRMLPKKLKHRFEKRIIKFINTKIFVGKGSVNITQDIKLLVAECAVKLTFGLKQYKFEQFQTIIIFKEEFYSEFSKTRNKGETNPAGAIVFSWKDILEGDIKDKDGINLGLHEFAHALMVMNLNIDGCEDNHFLSRIELFENFYNNYDKLSYVRSQNFLRDYGFSNKMEFFSVAVEQFFEAPDKMKETLPELYSILCSMLNQNPLMLLKQEPT